MVFSAKQMLPPYRKSKRQELSSWDVTHGRILNIHVCSHIFREIMVWAEMDKEDKVLRSQSLKICAGFQQVQREVKV